MPAQEFPRPLPPAAPVPADRAIFGLCFGRSLAPSAVYPACTLSAWTRHRRRGDSARRQGVRTARLRRRADPHPRARRPAGGLRRRRPLLTARRDAPAHPGCHLARSRRGAAQPGSPRGGAAHPRRRLRPRQGGRAAPPDRRHRCGGQVRSLLPRHRRRRQQRDARVFRRLGLFVALARPGRRTQPARPLVGRPLPARHARQAAHRALVPDRRPLQERRRDLHRRGALSGSACGDRAGARRLLRAARRRHCRQPRAASRGGARGDRQRAAIGGGGADGRAGRRCRISRPVRSSPRRARRRRGRALRPARLGTSPRRRRSGQPPYRGRLRARCHRARWRRIRSLEWRELHRLGGARRAAAPARRGRRRRRRGVARRQPGRLGARLRPHLAPGRVAAREEARRRLDVRRRRLRRLLHRRSRQSHRRRAHHADRLDRRGHRQAGHRPLPGRVARRPSRDPLARRQRRPLLVAATVERRRAGDRRAPPRGDLLALPRPRRRRSGPAPRAGERGRSGARLDWRRRDRRVEPAELPRPVADLARPF